MCLVGVPKTPSNQELNLPWFKAPDKMEIVIASQNAINLILGLQGLVLEGLQPK